MERFLTIEKSEIDKKESEKESEKEFSIKIELSFKEMFLWFKKLFRSFDSCGFWAFVGKKHEDKIAIIHWFSKTLILPLSGQRCCCLEKEWVMFLCLSKVGV